jgi:hypothetical protein
MSSPCKKPIFFLKILNYLQRFTTPLLPIYLQTGNLISQEEASYYEYYVFLFINLNRAETKLIMEVTVSLLTKSIWSNG